MTRLFKIFLAIIFLLFGIGIGLARAQGIADAMPPGIGGVVSVLTRWPVGPIEWIFVSSGFAGMIGNWLNERRLGNTLDTFTDHFLMVDPHYMVATLLIYWYAAMTILSTVAIATAKWPGAIVAGVALGVLFDAWISKKQR